MMAPVYEEYRAKNNFFLFVSKHITYLFIFLFLFSVLITCVLYNFFIEFDKPSTVKAVYLSGAMDIVGAVMVLLGK